MVQLSLEEFMNERIKESIEKKFKDNILLDNLCDPEGESRCQYRGRLKLRLYSRAIYLYLKNGEVKVLTDIDHIYGRCRQDVL